MGCGTLQCLGDEFFNLKREFAGTPGLGGIAQTFHTSAHEAIKPGTHGVTSYATNVGNNLAAVTSVAQQYRLNTLAFPVVMALPMDSL